MKKMETKSMPGKVSDIDFDKLYEELSRDWRLKADSLQARRWRKLQHEIKGSMYLDSPVKQGGGIL
jgi:hypothetical protein